MEIEIGALGLMASECRLLMASEIVVILHTIGLYDDTTPLLTCKLAVKHEIKPTRSVAVAKKADRTAEPNRVFITVH